MMAAPPVDPDVDLGQLPWFPILRRRLFRSEFHLKATDAEWRAGMTIWLRSMDQQPSGSLPNDDGQLQALAGLARQRGKWQRVKAMALRGWYVCDDGRLYHDTVAEVVNDAISRRNLARTKGESPAKSKVRFRDRNRREGVPLSGDIPLPVVPPPEGGTARPPSSSLDERGRTAPEPVWPAWLEEIYGPAPEGPRKRAAELEAAASRRKQAG